MQVGNRAIRPAISLISVIAKFLAGINCIIQEKRYKKKKKSYNSLLIACHPKGRALCFGQPFDIWPEQSSSTLRFKPIAPTPSEQEKEKRRKKRNRASNTKNTQQVRNARE